MKIALLGAGGFIGSHAVEHLLAGGEHHVTGVDVTRAKLDEVLAGLPTAARARWRFHEADVRASPELLREVVRAADVVVDLVAYANPSLYVTQPLDVFETNFVQNLAIVRLCVEHDTWLVQYSSAEVYGKARGEPYDEEATDFVFGPVCRQRWIYATAKALLERVIHAHGEAGELRYTIVRPFNFLGPRIDYLVPSGVTGGPRVFPHFMSALLTGGPIRLVGGGHARRAFLHVRDGSRALQTILDEPEASRNRIFNVGNPANDVTIRELAEMMLSLYHELTGAPAHSALEVVSGEEFYGAGYEDSSREPPAIARLGALGWTPRYDLRTTLRETMGYYLDRRGEYDAVLRAGADRHAAHPRPRRVRSGGSAA